MIYLLWSVLNLAALIWFLFICFGVLKLIRQDMGLGAVVIFVIGSLSLISNSVKNRKPDLPFGRVVKNEKVETFQIKSGLLYHIDLMYILPDTMGKEIKSTTVKYGVVIGHEWKPAFSQVNFKKGHLHYYAVGMHEWKFMGLTLYTEDVELKGVK
ncbi:hypothetical protein [Dyadobacter psychrotolerans]|uniref:Uncharacterized protein n=1 Tax=Dyadobacter psychrotolerans TaxID=2541721 RepID=A0A4R5DX72_9BACT|nr:hypothetical protein [Dyadobacter psychrotolerans]TDE16771.1 hypothetical protein E0F88_11155 [Dyadobacter psychrotolerans]